MSDLPQVSNSDQPVVAAETPDQPVLDPVAEPITDPLAPSAEQAVVPNTASHPAADVVEEAEEMEAIAPSPAKSAEPPPSYVKLAMRNMVKKRGISIQHFALTTVGLLGLLLGLAYLTR